MVPEQLRHLGKKRMHNQHLRKTAPLKRGVLGGCSCGGGAKRPFEFPIRQVFVNLLSNAIKFTRKRDKAEIAVGYQEMDGHGAYSVRHNGVGFYMEYASNSRQTIRCASPQHTQTVWLILSEVGVFREQRQMLTDGLPDQHAVER